MKLFFRLRFLAYLILLFLLTAILAIIYCNHEIESSAGNKLFSNIDSIPVNHVGLLLGTSKYLRNGVPNEFYTNRIIAAKELLLKGKIEYLVISGDNSTLQYNEPRMMKDDIVAAGIDSNRIFLDYAGFRTFDSVIRMREIFSQYSITIISQKFHNERALFIADREGIQAIAYNAKDVTKWAGFGVNMREKLARVKVYIDYIFRVKPRFLGEKINIPQ